MKRLLVAAGLAACLLLPAGASAQTSSGCQFVLGFKTLHDLDPGDIGDCVDNQAYAANGDAQQHTTKGLMVWRKADNWTAFTNGYMTWINGPNGLVHRLNTDRFPWEAQTPPASPPAQPTPSTAPVVTVALTDSSFSPSTVTIPTGGTVIWANNGLYYHSAQTLVGAPLAFNVGAIPNTGSLGLTFFEPGTYNYTAGSDCLLPQGGVVGAFSCGAPFSIVVTGQPAQAAPGNQTVTIDDSFGFSPSAVSIRAGQTVTWASKSTNTATHSVVISRGLGLVLDSGGIGPGQTFSYTFATPALIGYHSSTDAVYQQPVGLSSPVQDFKFVGTVSVSS